MRKTILYNTLFFLLLLGTGTVQAADENTVQAADETSVKAEALTTPEISVKADSLTVSELSVKTDTLTATKKKPTFWKKVGGVFKAFARELTNIDTAYVEPQHYNLSAQLQSINTFEYYSVKTESGKKISFSPDATYRLGPSGGYRFLCYGFSVDLKHLSSSSKSNRRMFNMSIFNKMFGIDFYWLDSGNAFHVNSMDVNLGTGDMQPLKDIIANGLSFNMRGLSFYYIFNHRRFSYPSVYAQSTVQKKSAGSMMLGFGYTRHALDVDWEQVDNTVKKTMGMSIKQLGLDSLTSFNAMRFADLSLSCGYAYNWAFAKCWALNASATMAFAYNQPASYTHPGKHLFHFHDFSFKNINLYEVGRVGVVWNNNTWFAGANAMVRNYQFSRNKISIRHTLSAFTIYFGYNFWKRKEYRRK